MPLVSILMAAYNATQYIDEAISSVLQQSLEDWELIIVDDCSTDGMAEHLTKTYAADRRIKIIRMEKNGGPGAAREEGLRWAMGEWVTVLDCDDRYMPNRLRNLYDLGQAHSLDLIADNQLLYDDHTKDVSRTAFVIDGRSADFTLEMLIANDGPTLNFSLGMLKPFVRMQFLADHNITYPNDERNGEDFTFLFHILCHGAKAILVNDPYYIYTLATSPVTNKLSSKKFMLDKSDARMEEALRSHRKLAAYAMRFCAGDKKVFKALDKRQSLILCSRAKREILRKLPQGRVVSVIQLILKERWGDYVAEKIFSILYDSLRIRKQSTNHFNWLDDVS